MKHLAAVVQFVRISEGCSFPSHTFFFSWFVGYFYFSCSYLSTSESSVLPVFKPLNHFSFGILLLFHNSDIWEVRGMGSKFNDLMHTKDEGRNCWSASGKTCFKTQKNTIEIPWNVFVFNKKWGKSYSHLSVLALCFLTHFKDYLINSWWILLHTWFN